LEGHIQDNYQAMKHNNLSQMAHERYLEDDDMTSAITLV
jgi:hypothetical protein